MIMDCTPGNAADSQPPPPFYIGLLDGVGGVVAGLWGGDLCMTHVDLSNAFWSFLL